MRTKAQRTARWGKISALLAGVFVLCLLGVRTSFAFPPAPFYTIYGDVRDENGILIQPGAATIVLSYQSKEVGRYPLTRVAGEDYSYQIRIRLDMSAAGTASYNSQVLTTGSDYTLKVETGGQSFLPIELSAQLPKVGRPAARVRVDLTLGVDTDKDGLPDAWERTVLQRLGYPITDLWRITPNGVLEADGKTNLEKYISGTYSGDTAQSFYLKIKEATANDVGVEFYALTNKVYYLEKSGDLKNWVAVEFTLGSNKEKMSIYTASGVGVVQARIPWVSGEEKAFYRLKVR